jgi:anti-sigma-K factor RskA
MLQMQYDLPDDKLLPNPDDEATRALLPGYAFGTTTHEETRQVEALLARYPALRRELAAYRQLGDALLVDTPPLEPPAGAWDSILSQINAEAQPVAPAPVVTALGRRLREMFIAPRLRLSPVLAAVLVAAVFAVVALLGAENTRLRSEYAQLAAQLSQQDVALELMRARDVGWVRMTDPSAPEASPSFAWLVYSPGDRAGVILASGFPALQPSMTYQLWANGDEGRVSLGLFDVDASGTGSITFQLPDDLSRFRSMGITPEPASGSPGPTSPAVVRLDLEPFLERLAQRS